MTLPQPPIDNLLARCSGCLQTLAEATFPVPGHKDDIAQAGLEAIFVWNDHVRASHPGAEAADVALSLFWKAGSLVLSETRWPLQDTLPDNPPVSVSVPPSVPTQKAVESEPPPRPEIEPVAIVRVSVADFAALVAERNHLRDRVHDLMRDCSRHEQEARDARTLMVQGEAVRQHLIESLFTRATPTPPGIPFVGCPGLKGRISPCGGVRNHSGFCGPCYAEGLRNPALFGP